ncbi:MAG: ABC transporter permease [Acidobacteriota bacterium]
MTGKGSFSWRRWRAVARKECLHILRDPRSLIMSLALPALLLLLFGYALTLDVDRIPLVIRDGDQTPASRMLLERFRASRYFSIEAVAAGEADLDAAIDWNRCLGALVILPGFADAVAKGEPAPVQFILNGTDSNTAAIAAGYARSLVESFNRELRNSALQRRLGRGLEAPVQVDLRVWFNSSLKSRNYIVPGLIAVTMMIIAALLTSLTLAREWEMGTMEQLLATPVKPLELVLGKMSAYFMLGVADTVLAILLGVGWFGVPFRGSVLLLGLGCGIFLVGALCWGVMISAIARNQLLAYQMGMISSFLPAFLLSGFIYAIENMPLPVQLVTYIVPARYFIVLLRGIFLKGVGFSILWVQFLFLFVFAVFVVLLASRKVKGRLA